MKPQLVVALDVPTIADIKTVLNSLPRQILYYKVGLELFTAEGPAAIRMLLNGNKRVFLDLKLHDIPRTVARAVASAARAGVSLLTVHASGGRDMLRAASESAGEHGESAPKIIAVTTLTSLNGDDLHEIGIPQTLAEHTLSLGKMAISAGIDGLVCSPNEASAFRGALGNGPILVTPGIRPAGAEAGDQKRFATPKTAVRAGADFLVVGRPILEASDPRAAALEILKQMDSCAGL